MPPFQPRDLRKDPDDRYADRSRLTTNPVSTTEGAMRFARANDVRSMIERMPLTKVNDAWARVTSGTARFRIALETGVRR